MSDDTAPPPREGAKVAIVTGGGRGIGAAIATGLAHDGFDVVVNYRRDEEAAEATCTAVRAAGRQALAVQGTVDDPAACRRLVDRTLEDLGRIDALVNNAGTASRGRTVADTDPEEVDRLLRVHAAGPHLLCGLALPALRRSRGGIVFISSAATDFMLAGSGPYNMAKAAMEALALTLAKEERQHGIHVNIVAPGMVETDMGRRLAKATEGVDDLRQLDATKPFGRVCQPEDVADVVRYLLSPRSAYVSGEKIKVDGGGELW